MLPLLPTLDILPSTWRVPHWFSRSSPYYLQPSAAGRRNEDVGAEGLCGDITAAISDCLGIRTETDGFGDAWWLRRHAFARACRCLRLHFSANMVFCLLCSGRAPVGRGWICIITAVAGRLCHVGLIRSGTFGFGCGLFLRLHFRVNLFAQTQPVGTVSPAPPHYHRRLVRRLTRHHGGCVVRAVP